MTATEIENRLIAIEQELAHLKSERTLAAKPHPIQALEKIHGSFENDAAFKEATRLGRKWRQSQRPKARSPKARRK